MIKRFEDETEYKTENLKIWKQPCRQTWGKKGFEDKTENKTEDKKIWWQNWLQNWGYKDLKTKLRVKRLGDKTEKTEDKYMMMKLNIKLRI